MAMKLTKELNLSKAEQTRLFKLYMQISSVFYNNNIQNKTDKIMLENLLINTIKNVFIIIKKIAFCGRFLWAR